jgi:glutaredoxin-like YruB-family protein
MAIIKVYGTPTCPWCVKARDYFKSYKIKFEDINVVDDKVAQQEMINKSSQMGVPVIDIDGVIIVGFDLPAIEKALGKGEEEKKEVKGTPKKK